MNPLRTIFMHISRTPPALMLLAIVGLAVLITSIVSDSINRREIALNTERKKLEDKINQKAVVVYAVRDIPEGQTIPSDAVEEHSIEAGRMPQDAICSASLVTGRIAKYGVSSGQILSQHDLAGVGISTGFGSQVKEGMRAVTFSVDANTGVAGFIQPESYVDIMAMVGSGGDTKVAPVLSDVKIIAVGQMYQKQPGGAAVPASSVTVALTPDDTTRLIKSVCASKLYLALRNDRDHTPLATVDITSLFPHAKDHANAQLISMQAPNMLPPPPLETSSGNAALPEQTVATAPPAPEHEVELWSGSRRDVLKYASR